MKIITIATVVMSFFAFLFIIGVQSYPDASSAVTKLSLPKESSKNGDSIHRNEEILNPPENVRRELTLGKVKVRVFQESFTAPAEVTPDLKRFAKVHSLIPGRIAKVMAWLGERIEKGKPLLVLESLELQEAVERYLTAKAKYEEADLNYKRAERLYLKKVITERSFLEQKRDYLTAKAEAERARDKLRLMGFGQEDFRQWEKGEKTVSSYLLRAPISGSIIEQEAVLGDRISPEDELFQIQDTSVVWVFANLPPEKARKVKEGEQALILTPERKQIPGKVVYVLEKAEQSTRTIKVKLEVSNEEGILRPGEFVEVKFSLDRGKRALAIPTTALFLLDGKPIAFVQRSKGFYPQELEIGEELSGYVEIIKGLSLGEAVVVKGGYYLKSELLKEEMGEAHH
jgi:cobalt-zinc-cadmium efflux system membrane fusion protein